MRVKPTRRRTALLALVALAFLPALGGCSGAPETAITGPVTITFWHGQTGAGAELLAGLAAEFSRLEPNVTVNLVHKGSPADIAAMLGSPASQAGVAGNGPVASGPALAEVPEEVLPGLQAQGSIEALQPFIANRSYGLKLEDLGDFWPCFVQANTAGRQVWGLPWSHKVYALVYDPARLDEPPATWDGLKAAATALTRRTRDPADSVFGLCLRPDADLFTLFLYQNGGQLLSGDPPRPVFNSPQGAGCLDYLWEVVALRKTVLLTMGDPIEAVTSGQAVMAIAPVGWPAGNAPGDGIAVAALPAGTARATLAPGTSLVMGAGLGPAEKEAAWRFLRFLTTGAVAARWAAATGDVPVRRSALETIAWRQGSGGVPGMPEAVAQMDIAVAIPGTPALPILRERLSAAVAPFLLGQVSSSQALLDDVVRAVAEAAPGP